MHIIIDIIFINRRHGHLIGVPFTVPQSYRPADLEGIILRQLMGDDRLPQGRISNPLPSLRVEIHKSRHLLRRPRHQIDGSDSQVRHQIHILFHDADVFLDSKCPHFIQGFPQPVVRALLQGNADVIGLYLPELPGSDVRDGILDAEPSHQQRGAPADAHHHHEQTLLVPENIPEGHFFQKSQPFPDKGHVLQEHPLPGFRGLGPHQRRRHLGQLHAAGKPGGADGAEQRSRQGYGRQLPVEHIIDRIRIVHDAIAEPYDLRECPCPQKEAGHTAGQRSQAGIHQIFGHDSALTVAQGFQHANLGPLLLHHPVHGGDAHQRRHQEEEHGEDVGNALHDGGIVLKADIADIGVPIQHIGIRLGQLRKLLLGVLDLSPGVRYLLLKLLSCLLVGVHAVLIFLPALRKLRLFIGDGLPARRKFLTGGCDFALPLRERPPAFFQGQPAAAYLQFGAG